MNSLTQLLSQSDEPKKTKKCSKCGEVKPLEKFSKDKAKTDGHQYYCKECSSVWQNKFMNTERGMMIDTINGIFNRPIKKSNRRKRWIPEISREGIWQIILNHICRIKEKFPRSNGRLCFYCHQPWTYVRGKTSESKTRSIALTNFSLDRFDCRFTYKNGNIVCCCFGCNHRKGNSTPEDWSMFIKAKDEME